MTKTTRPIDGHRAGRFVLAVAADDDQQLIDLMGEIAADPSDLAILAFASELASISINLAETHVGPGWRSALGADLVDHEMTYLDGPESY